MKTKKKSASTYKPTLVFDQKAFDLIQDASQIDHAVIEGARALPHLDDGETLVFARQLETIRQAMYEKKYAELKGRQFVDFSSEGGLETEYLTYRLWDSVTTAILVGNFSTDFPLVNQSAREITIKYHRYGNAYGYSMLDLRQAARAGSSLSTKAPEIARRGHELVMDDEVAYGVPALRTFGLLNNPNVTLGTVTNGTWASASAENILADMNQMVTTMWNNSSETWEGDTMLMSTLAYRLITTKILNTAGGTMTVKQAFLEQNPGIKIASWTKLNTANAAGTNGRIIFYKKSREVLEFEVGREFEVFPPTTKGMMITYPCLSSAAGVSIHQPLAIMYFDNANI